MIFIVVVIVCYCKYYCEIIEGYYWNIHDMADDILFVENYHYSRKYYSIIIHLITVFPFLLLVTITHLLLPLLKILLVMFKLLFIPLWYHSKKKWWWREEHLIAAEKVFDIVDDDIVVVQSIRWYFIYSITWLLHSLFNIDDVDGMMMTVLMFRYLILLVLMIIWGERLIVVDENLFLFFDSIYVREWCYLFDIYCYVGEVILFIWHCLKFRYIPFDTICYDTSDHCVLLCQYLLLFYLLLFNETLTVKYICIHYIIKYSCCWHCWWGKYGIKFVVIHCWKACCCLFCWWLPDIIVRYYDDCSDWIIIENEVLNIIGSSIISSNDIENIIIGSIVKIIRIIYYYYYYDYYWNYYYY